ncbi:acetyl-CoA carboxylase biotin carboxyl carrier protein subunit [Lentzea tibetensis]|uniref:Biotin carboxyl carrier protein of acetyl-CoA carboxylase n=1 Tax=Lentzea tibetensis TaxID=2591470 RepID=A0A563ERV9_9PSEU|nr:acetyl-CoA carboxylase biotin carboxyl carrier protein subunit [Lentzea tibetensis]TWP50390.1 acetyl-CoA carboxylase biotin carboxyl carrier protein subunit [Lentzea tibetensis]
MSIVPDRLPLGEEPPSLADERETVRELCRSLGDLVRGPAGRATRVVMAAGSVRVEVEWPVGEAGSVVPSGEGNALEAEPTGEVLRAEMVGTFYVAAEPGARPFAAVGDVVAQGQQVGIVEAMKLMNAVVAPCAGTVTEVLAADGQAVEYDQPLLVIAPAEQEE